MFRYDKKQTVFEIGGFKVGGQPGEYPTGTGKLHVL